MMNLSLLFDEGIASILKTAGRFYLGNAKGLAFLARTVPAMQRSAALRKRQEAQGLHVPPFLIASVASQCNLRCTGCYARAGGGCGGNHGEPDLDTAQWRAIFAQASELGVSFLLLAGGEPFLRRDILELAGEYPNMIFPVFTNGTLLDAEAFRLLDRCRNLVPVLSLEGEAQETDARRGAGTYARIESSMEAFKRRRILFGASITVTQENLARVAETSFLASLEAKGCGLVLYVEYVPVEEGTERLVLNAAEQRFLQEACGLQRERFGSMVLLSFPGDEEALGGCLASGRGFFHINPYGDAEPCPFSPHSKQNLKDVLIRDVLQSEFFADLRALAAATPHHGGCALFERRQEVRHLAES